MSETVWVGWVDEGAFSDKETDIIGVYATREAGQRAACECIEGLIANEQSNRKLWIGTQWETHALETIDRNIASYRRSLTADWSEPLPDVDYGYDYNRDKLPPGAIYLSLHDTRPWRFCLAPFSVTE